MVFDKQLISRISKSMSDANVYHKIVDDYIINIYSGSIEFLDDINKLIYDLFNYSGILIKDKRKNHTYRLSIQSSVIFWYFISLGLSSGKKINLSVPRTFKTESNYMINLIAGLVDTDGHVAGNMIQLKQKSKSLLEELKNYLYKFDMNPAPVKVNYTYAKPFYYIRFDNKWPLRFKNATVAQTFKQLV